MGRMKRVSHPGLVVHVVNRGNNRQKIFHEEDDYRRYLSVVQHYKKKFGFHLFAFCLMTNHVHLLIRVGEKSVSKIMQSITLAHTKHYHFKYSGCGHVWQGRFKSPVVSDDDHLLTVMAYIEQNPVRAKMVPRVDDYRWSSFKMNASFREFPLVDRRENPVWPTLGRDDRERITAYRKLVEGRIGRDRLEEIVKSTRGQGHFMSERYRKRLAALIPEKRRPGRPRTRGIKV